MSREYWDKKHNDYLQEDWINSPNIFATEAIEYFPKEGHLLDLGAGQGQDSRFFASKNYNVMSTDYSDNALALSLSKIDPYIKDKISVKHVDLTEPLSFNDGEFDIVYSHLALHYFDKTKTQEIFNEIHRVLKPEGIVAMLLNTTDDPEIKDGVEIEKDYYDFGKLKKRFFNTDSLKEFIETFEIILLDNKGTTVKDSRLGINNLIRFIGKKI